MKTTNHRRKAKVRSYDFSKGVRGKYAGRFTGSNVVVLAPDVAKSFPDSKSVNAALRAVKELSRMAGA
jgi:hypothetical protein